MSEPILEISHLSRDFHLRAGFGRTGEIVHAVNDVSFAVPRGGSVALVGESGSGKTTTARIVVGLETSTSGSVSFDGRTLSPHPKPRDRRQRSKSIQMVFQDPFSSLDPHQTAGQALEEVLAVHRVVEKSARQLRVTEAFGEVGLDERDAASRPRQLSGGQCQRVAIARALAVQPKLLVLDEAVSALDVSVQAQILNLLAGLRERLGLTMLLISHDLAVVRQICEQVVVMHRGRLVEAGDVDQVLSNPREPYTQHLLESLPRTDVTL
jgi:oligopeptide transport system ATP-binding protein